METLRVSFEAEYDETPADDGQQFAVNETLQDQPEVAEQQYSPETEALQQEISLFDNMLEEIRHMVESDEATELWLESKKVIREATFIEDPVILVAILAGLEPNGYALVKLLGLDAPDEKPKVLQSR